MLEAMAAFCHAWAPVYDAVVYLHGRYDAHAITDPLRARVLTSRRPPTTPSGLLVPTAVSA